MCFGLETVLLGWISKWWCDTRICEGWCMWSLSHFTSSVGLCSSHFTPSILMRHGGRLAHISQSSMVADASIEEVYTSWGRGLRAVVSLSFWIKNKVLVCGAFRTVYATTIDLYDISPEVVYTSWGRGHAWKWATLSARTTTHITWWSQTWSNRSSPRRAHAFEPELSAPTPSIKTSRPSCVLEPTWANREQPRRRSFVLGNNLSFRRKDEVSSQLEVTSDVLCYKDDYDDHGFP